MIHVYSELGGLESVHRSDLQLRSIRRLSRIRGMDAKAALRSRKREAARSAGEKINSPFVRYNGLGQPVCKVCNSVIKSEALWTAHTVSRQHKTAVEEFKARAAVQLRPDPAESTSATAKRPLEISSSSLPDNFFDKKDAKRPDLGVKINVQHGSSEPASKVEKQEDRQTGSVGSLPQGFFDNREADSRARGLEVPKINIQDEYNEFQKSIQEDVKGMDVRLDEEEFEAAEDREEEEQRKQRNLMERIEIFRKRQQEKAEAASKAKEVDLESTLNATEEEEESDGSDDDNYLVDWRAKRL